MKIMGGESMVRVQGEPLEFRTDSIRGLMVNTLTAASAAMVRDWTIRDGSPERTAQWMSRTVRIGSLAECRGLVAAALMEMFGMGAAAIPGRRRCEGLGGCEAPAVATVWRGEACGGMFCFNHLEATPSEADKDLPLKQLLQTITAVKRIVLDLEASVRDRDGVEAAVLSTRLVDKARFVVADVEGWRGGVGSPRLKNI